MNKIPRKNQFNALTAMRKVIKGIICQPTGAGKTDIEIWSILEEIKSRNYGFCVCVLIGPKIILMQQHRKDVSNSLIPQMSGNGEIKFLAVHSGSEDSTEFDEECSEYGLAELGLENTTSSNVIIKEIQSAQQFNYPIILLSTYHSANRIITALAELELKAAIVNHDEAHHLGGEESNGQFSSLPQEFEQVCEKQFFFTATPVRTKSKNGTGMDNAKFGGLIEDAYYKPANAIIDGYILRPRVMLISVDGEKPKADKNTNEFLDDKNLADISALIDGFDALRKSHDGKIAPKLLCTMRGRKHLRGITSSERFKEYCSLRPNLHTFEIISGHSQYTWGGAVLDGRHVKERKEFLTKLNEITSNPLNEVIIFHYDILTEGIDISGITGVMLFRQLNKTKLIQLLGRAARIYTVKDKSKYGMDDNSRICREFQETGILKTGEDFDHNKWVKPYAWIIIPTYGELGEDLSCFTYDMIEELRSFNFDPYKDIIVPQAGSNKPAQTIEQIGASEEKVKVQKLNDEIDKMIVKCEDAEYADRIGKEMEKIRKEENYWCNFIEF